MSRPTRERIHRRLLAVCVDDREGIPAPCAAPGRYTDNGADGTVSQRGMGTHREDLAGAARRQLMTLLLLRKERAPGTVSLFYTKAMELDAANTKIANFGPNMTIQNLPRKHCTQGAEENPFICEKHGMFVIIIITFKGQFDKDLHCILNMNV